jgi:Flp pilus assembly protein TadG
MATNSKRRLGSSLAETAATFAYVVPLFFLVLFIAIEASQVYGLSQALQQAARESARRLATTYAVDPGIVANVGDQKKYGFDPVRITGVINDSAQFTATFNPDSKTGTMGSVTVTASYLSGQFGLPQFPQIDPLLLGRNLQLKATATYTLE